MQYHKKSEIDISLLNAGMTQNFGSDSVRSLVDKKLYGTTKKNWWGLINGAPTTHPPKAHRGSRRKDFVFSSFSVIWALQLTLRKISTDGLGLSPGRGRAYTLGSAWLRLGDLCRSTDN